MAPKRIGIVGYGHLGHFLAKEIAARDDMEVAFIWNRSPGALEEVDKRLVCQDLAECGTFGPDLIVEVAHPDISKQFGLTFLSVSHYFIGSPSALADAELFSRLKGAAEGGPFGLYVPSGAFWGAQDVKKMADLGTLKSLTVTMRKHPSCFKLAPPLKELNQSVTDSVVVLYRGPVRGLCPLAPNNVNTMAAGAIAGHNLGFDEVMGVLISDPQCSDRHVVSIEVEGPNGFRVTTQRDNPAGVGAVTGNTTYTSFLSSVVIAGQMGKGLHLC